MHTCKLNSHKAMYQGVGYIADFIYLNCFIKTTADYKHVVLRISCSLGDFFNK